MFAVPAIPVETDRRALKRKSEEEGDEVAKCHSGGDFDHPTSPCGRENSQVKQEEANLRQRDAGDVKKLLDVEELPRLVKSKSSGYWRTYIENASDLVEFQSPYISS